MRENRRLNDWTSELSFAERRLLHWLRDSQVVVVVAASVVIALFATITTLGTFSVFNIGPNEPAWHIGLWLSVTLPMIFGPLLLGYISRLVSLLDSTGERFQTLALYDPLTSVLNRRGFRQLFNETEPCQDCQIAVVDINRFKELNDVHGHDVGDKALVMVAKWLTELAGEAALVARFGGDEFVAIVPEKTEIARHVDIPLGNIAISLSVGMCPLRSDIDEALHCADKALYEAKNAIRVRETDAA